MRDLTQYDKWRHPQERLIGKRYSRHVGAHIVKGDASNGAFFVPARAPSTLKFKVIASAGGGWDHVSVSLPARCPKWSEMELIKRLFFEDDENAMQLHVATNKHINLSQFCLHLWRPHDVEIPLPPVLMV